MIVKNDKTNYYNWNDRHTNKEERQQEISLGTIREKLLWVGRVTLI